jgi:hypothetical protein
MNQAPMGRMTNPTANTAAASSSSAVGSLFGKKTPAK